LLTHAAFAFHEHFEGESPTWTEAGSDASYRMMRHRRTRETFHEGASCEQVEFVAGNGSIIYLAHAIQPARIIDELVPSVWVKGDRLGTTLNVRVVLPRSKNAKTGLPLTTIIAGSTYSQAGTWQQLSISRLPELLTRHVRALRTEHGANIDSREAYIDRVLLNVYGGEGITRVWIDDLEVAGEVGLRDVIVAENNATAGQLSSVSSSISTPRELADARQWHRAKEPTASTNSASSLSAVSQSMNVRGPRATSITDPNVLPAAWNEAANNSGRDDSQRLKLNGTRLMLEGHAILPRIIEYRGESLRLLKSLGFNMVWLDEIPSDSFLAEAASIELWIICPPPTPEAIEAGALTAKFNIVAAWNLGLERTEGDIQLVRTWAERLHTKDPIAGRPTLIGCHDELRAFSRVADVVLVGRNPIGTSTSMIEYGRHLAAGPRLARPGTPLWVRIPTEPDVALVGQWAAFSAVLGEAFGGGRAPSEAGGSVLSTPGAPANLAQPADWQVIPPGAGLSSQQLRSLLYTALATGGRGFLFHSRTPLDSNDRETHRRRAMLELLNLELALIEPWAAGGSFVTSAPSTEADLFGVAMQTERARLLLPVRSGKLDQFVAEPLGWQARAFVVPGVPDSNEAYELTPSGLRQLAHKRVTGGIRVSQDPYAGGALVVMSSDPRIASDLSRQVARTDKRAAELKRELALTDLQNVESIERRLPSSATPRDVGELLSTARTALEQSRTLITTNDWRRSYEKSEMAMVILGRLQRRRWQELASRWPSVIASPLATSYAMLPQHTKLVGWLDTAQVDPNGLAGGDIESLDWMLESGWRHYLHPQPGIGSDVELSPAAPHEGKYSLRLRAWSDVDTSPPTPVETAPVWVTSAPVRVAQGDIVRIRGFVRLPEEPLGSAEGLLVIDSLGGLPLAERIHAHKGWQEFTLFRAAAQTGELTITFALSGLGEAYIDDLAVEQVRFGQPGGAIPQASRLNDIFSPPSLRR
jgi:hypothetical protein